MEIYKNFDLALYVTAPFLKNTDLGKIEKKLNSLEKHLNIDKVYLETHRGANDIDLPEMEQVKKLFQEHDIQTSGGITPTLGQNEFEDKPERIMNVFCYTDKRMKNRIKEISERTASLFDEFILDDFFFTNCTCSICRSHKGNRSWAEFRTELMADVSKELIIDPAKKINSAVKVIIKYPNWIESYQNIGYNTELQPDIFDAVYTGTETRNPGHTRQHLPKYAGYSLMRWMENTAPGENAGGWFDSINCIYNIGSYLEQAYMTLFAGGRELTLFNFSSMADSVFVPPLGHKLSELDTICGELDAPRGVPVYIPHHSRGEDHLYDFLGMSGFPVEPVSSYPGKANIKLLTSSSAHDNEVISKIKNDLTEKNSTVILTSGFLNLMQDQGLEELLSVRYTDKKIAAERFGIQSKGCGYQNTINGSEKILFPVLDYSRNDNWPLIAAMQGDNALPFLLKSKYGQGELQVLAVPDNYSDIYHLPSEVLNELRKLWSKEQGIYLEGESQVSLFLYDNNRLIVESFLTYDINVQLHLEKNNVKLKDLIKDKIISGHQKIKNKSKKTIFDIDIEPGTYRCFKIIG